MKSTILFSLLAPASFLPAHSAALAQAAPDSATDADAETQAEEPSADELEEEEIVVVGARPRGAVIGDIPPENTLAAADIRATGATDVTELLEALAPQIGSARGRGGERPILLLNGQRISSFRELRDIPTEAIARVEILPEEVALRYGYKADQRVVNFVLRQRFRSTSVRLDGETATEGGYLSGLADITRLTIGSTGRTTVNVRAEGNGLLTESERDVDLPAGSEVDDREARSLQGSRRLLRGSLVSNRQIGTVGATANLELERSTGRALLGLSDALLSPLVRNSRTESAHAGLALNGAAGGWRWSATGNADLARSTTLSDPSEESASRDRTRSIRRSVDLDLLANGTLAELPAGDLAASVRLGGGALQLDSSRHRAGASSDTDLARSRAFVSGNLDIPLSRRSRNADALGNLTLNLNAQAEALSDFGTLSTFGAGVNWSPVNRLNLSANWTREEGSPSIESLGDPVLETPETRVFDFTRGETALVTAVTGGNPDLLADRRSVLKIAGNWRVLDDRPNLRLRAEFVRSRIDDPASSFPGASAALEAAFPDRFERNEAGELIRVDLRPVNFEEARRDTLRWGFDLSQPLQSRRPSPEQIARFRQARGAAQPSQNGSGAPAPTAEPQNESGFGRGGGRFGGQGGGRGGRLSLSLTHTVNLRDEVIIAPGLPELDYLDGEAVGSTGGRPRHEVELSGGWSNNGLGARMEVDWRSGSRVDGGEGTGLRFSPVTTADLRLFANLGQQWGLVSRHPWLRGSSVRLEVDNLFNARPRVRDSDGDVPSRYQPDLLDPLGRTISISFRKLFLPPRGFFRPGGGGRGER
jgi:hypothetical protein